MTSRDHFLPLEAAGAASDRRGQSIPGRRCSRDKSHEGERTAVGKPAQVGGVKRLPPTADLTPDVGRDRQGIDERRIEGEDGQVVRHTEVSAAAGADLTLQPGLQVHGLADW